MLIDSRSRALQAIHSPYKAFQPPRRVSVSQGASETLVFKQPSMAPKEWSAELTPYMVEPMDMLASRKHEAVVFTGPARTGKTGGLLLGWMSHNVVNDPGDMLFIQMSQDKAREFSKTDVSRALENSPKVKALLGRAQDKNTHDIMFKHGMWLRIAWPTVSNVSGSTYRYGAITDLDRIPNADNVDGEGSLFSLLLKRVQTYGSRGMALAESSPGIPLSDPNWRPATPHEAPPVTGILGLYNQSDRRRWYWRCLHCGEWFEAAPGLSLFGLPSDNELLEIIRESDLEEIATQHNRVICPLCQGQMTPKHKKELNRNGVWLPDGVRMDKYGERHGKPLQSSIAGYWMGGAAAAYQSWRSIVLRYLQGLRNYALTNSEETLKTTVNTDQGMPYMSRLLIDAKNSALDPASRAESELARYIVPAEARFLVATVDVQGGMNARFVVQVHAIGPYREKWLIDRYNIILSNREGMGDEFAPIDPGRYKEDWDLVTEKVVRCTYKTPIEGKEMRVRLTVVDSGGEEGVTDNAYDWYRRCRREGLESRIMLIKGEGKDQKANFPFIKQTMVGGRNGKEHDIVLYLLNTNRLKDVIETGMQRTTPGPGYVHVPGWLPRAWWDEFMAEVRGDNGVWNQIRKRNEARDLLVYAEAGCLRLGADKLDWATQKVPTWARPLESNSDLITREERRYEQEDRQIASMPIADAPRNKKRRQAARSGYLR